MEATKLATCDLDCSEVCGIPVNPATETRAQQRCMAERLEAAINPIGPIEQLLTEEIARRPFNLDLIDRATIDHLCGAQKAFAVVYDAARASDATDELLLASAVVSNTHRELASVSLAQSQALIRSVNALSSITAERRLQSQALSAPDFRFSTEQACCSYLVRRFRNGSVCCNKCRQRHGGCWIARTRSWQCDNCHNQTGIRHGSVMANSPISLVTWFHAIRILLLRPSTASRELSHWLAIQRIATVRSVLSRIRRAISKEDGSSLLVGLDQVYLACEG
jgi:hypothetical protein